MLLDGTELSSASDRELSRIRAEEIGFVFQGFNLIPTLTARENVETALAPLGDRGGGARAAVDEALAPSASPIAATTCRASSPADSSSASRSPAPS